MNVVLMVPESFGVKKQFNTVVLMPRIPAARRKSEVMVRIYDAHFRDFARSTVAANIRFG